MRRLMPLPKIDSKEWDDEIKFYQNSNRGQKIKRAKDLKFATVSSYEARMNERGIHIKNTDTLFSPDSTEEPIIVNLPPVKLKEYHPEKTIGKKGDPETQILHLTDNHAGQLTKSFNTDIYKSRLEHLFQSTLKITNLHRNMYPVDNLEIFMTGDMIHGENPKQGGKVEGISCGARSQVITIALPTLSELILSLKQKFKSVNLHCVRGNHGRYSREAPATSNWDLLLYDLLKEKLGHYDINVDISEEFYNIVEIQNHKFFLCHLDQCKASQGIPWFSLVRKIRSWFVTYGGFDYVIGGHWHRDDHLRINSRCKLFVGASIVTDDPFSEEIIGDSTIPCQWTFGVHKDRGVTWSYPLIVDDKYF